MAGVEELYKQFGILADANEKAGEVNLTIFPIKLNMAPIPSRGSEAKPFIFVLCKPNRRKFFPTIVFDSTRVLFWRFWLL